jgi:hypothetical protein
MLLPPRLPTTSSGGSAVSAYHCSKWATSGECPVDEHGYIIVESLCGLRNMRNWDFVRHFVLYSAAAGRAVDDYKCPKCENHPDLPMMALGVMP